MAVKDDPKAPVPESSCEWLLPCTARRSYDELVPMRHNNNQRTFMIEHHSRCKLSMKGLGVRIAYMEMKASIQKLPLKVRV